MPTEHSHGHPTDPDIDAHALSEGQILEMALRELLIEKGVVTQPELNEQMNRTASQSASFGASVIARAWKDKEFKRIYYITLKRQSLILVMTFHKCLI